MIDQTINPNEIAPLPAPSKLLRLWNRGDVWRIFGLFFLLWIVTNIVVAAITIANGGDITIAATIANTLMMTLTLAGSVFFINWRRPKHTFSTLGFSSTTRNWLLVAAGFGALLPFRALPLQALLTQFPALNFGLDALMEMLVFESLSEQIIAGIAVALFAPVYEEVFFRGYVQNAMAGRWGRWVGIIGSGLFFGLFHLIPLQAISAIPLGLLCAWVYDRTGSLWPAILLHAVNNFLAVAILPLFM